MLRAWLLSRLRVARHCQQALYVDMLRDAAIILDGKNWAGFQKLSLKLFRCSPNLISFIS